MPGLQTSMSEPVQSRPSNEFTGMPSATAASRRAASSSHAVTDAPARQSAPAAVRPERARPMTATVLRSEEHTSELQSLMRISYAVFCLKNKNNKPSARLYKPHTNQKTTTHG